MADSKYTLPESDVNPDSHLAADLACMDAHKAACSPVYLSATSNDPFLSTFILADMSDKMAERDRVFKVMYTNWYFCIISTQNI